MKLTRKVCEKVSFSSMKIKLLEVIDQGTTLQSATRKFDRQALQSPPSPPSPSSYSWWATVEADEPFSQPTFHGETSLCACSPARPLPKQIDGISLLPWDSSLLCVQVLLMGTEHFSEAGRSGIGVNHQWQKNMRLCKNDMTALCPFPSLSLTLFLSHYIANECHTWELFLCFSLQIHSCTLTMYRRPPLGPSLLSSDQIQIFSQSTLTRTCGYDHS